MKVLITGGAGFIGSHLLDQLIANQHEVCVFDNFSYGKKAYLPESGFKLIEGDITDKELVRHSFYSFKPNIVFHLAALHHIPTCENKPDEALKINIEGTQHVLNAAKEIEDLQRIVFASSGAVYDIADHALLEDITATVPYDVYSVSKLSGEYLMRLWANKYGKEAIVGRIFNTIGGRETNAHLVPEIIAQVLMGKQTIELGNLDPKRSYIDARDTSSALYHLGFYDTNKKFDIFNIGREDEFDVKDIVKFIEQAHGQSIQIEQSASRIRKVDRKRQLASIEKIKKVTGWSPTHSVAEGILYAYKFDNETRNR
jgi:UDP-glucose 4-epimerase